MLPLGWQDRKSSKSQLLTWLNASHPMFAVSVNDSQEINDIEEWLRVKFDDGLIGHATFAVDTEILKYALLEMIVFNLGEENFSEFIKETRSTPVLSPVTISQSLGDGARAKDEIDYEKNTQKIDIHLDSNLLQKQYYFEKNIFPLLNIFSKDVQRLAKKNKILFVINFKKIGENKDVGSDFLVWFQEQFLYKMSQIQDLKICVIFQGNIDRLTKINEGQKIHLQKLNLQDILEATKEHIIHHEEFCNGVIDPDNNDVEYRVFKRKFHVRMQKLTQESQNG